MRSSIILLAAGAALVAAQGGIKKLPQCGQVCIANMLQIAQTQFGCAAGNATCYCTNKDFGYGIRDCSNESCPTSADAQEVIAFGVKYCKKVLSGGAASVSASSAAASASAGASAGASSAASSGASSGAASGASASASSAVPAGYTRVPITTSALTTVIKSGGSKVTSTIGSTTLYSLEKVRTEYESETITSGGATYTTVTGSTVLYGSAAASASASSVAVSSEFTTETTKGKTITKATGKTTLGGGGPKGTKTTGGGGGGGAAASSSSTSSGNFAVIATAAPGLIGAAALAVLAL